MTNAAQAMPLPADIERAREQSLALEGREQFVDAARCWEVLIERWPNCAEAMSELGALFLRMKRWEDALRWFRRVLDLRPELTAAKTNAGAALRQLNRLDDAATLLREALASAPDDAGACLNLGLCLSAQKRPEEGLAWLQKASQLRPADAESARELANALVALKRNDEAATAFQQAVSLQPDDIPLLQSFGECLQGIKRFAEAAPPFRRVVEIEPNNAKGWINLGGALIGLQEYAQSLAAFRRALLLEPGSVVSYCNMSLALWGLDRLTETEEALRKALAIEPGSAVASFNLGCIMLAQGQMREGWECYEYRFAIDAKTWFRADVNAVPWTNEPLAGKSILVIGEQGNGDHIQFVRYLPALCELGASVCYVAPARLHRLFRSLHGAITFEAEPPKDVRFDFQCPLMSLPGRFERLGLPLPTRPYLHAEPERVAFWRERLSPQSFRIGVAWRGNQSYDQLRSFRLDALRPVAALPGMHLVSLQLKEGTGELDGVPTELHIEDPGPDFDTGPDGFVDCAAVIAQMDLIISCDTSIAHLAGALGVPMWIAINQSPEWRWQRQRTDNIWYPSARIFRQEGKGDWDGVFCRMAEELPALLRARAADRNTGPSARRRPPSVEMGWGHLLERIALLELDAGAEAPNADARLVRELSGLRSALAAAEPLPAEVKAKWEALRQAGEKLRVVDAEMQACAHENRFDERFIALAREAQQLNEERGRIKQAIDAAFE